MSSHPLAWLADLLIEMAAVSAPGLMALSHVRHLEPDAEPEADA